MGGAIPEILLVGVMVRSLSHHQNLAIRSYNSKTPIQAVDIGQETAPT